MSIIEIFLIAIGLSMDAFAVSICIGLTMPKATLRKAGVVGLYFGGFQALMPLIGYFAATLLAEKIVSYDHWIAFVLLCFIGGKMVISSFKKAAYSSDTCPDRTCPNPKEFCTDRVCPRKVAGDDLGAKEASLGPVAMLPLAIATSIDALAVGVSFAFLHVEIAPAVSLIGATTLTISMCGVKIGNVFGTRFKAQSELIGGAILVLIGLKILLEHTIGL